MPTLHALAGFAAERQKDKPVYELIAFHSVAIQGDHAVLPAALDELSDLFVCKPLSGFPGAVHAANPSEVACLVSDESRYVAPRFTHADSLSVLRDNVFGGF